ncbi:hypothetical protein A5810_002805 [Enterococcus faecium]|uniref:Uncharacterized protein n=1 Tax=Enterococcus faecium TaxID=1352 RepID=A0A2C9X2E8_ENTFC|nr:hypothetical protein A5810_002805 [Enterococcus faecium]
MCIRDSSICASPNSNLNAMNAKSMLNLAFFFPHK